MFANVGKRLSLLVLTGISCLVLTPRTGAAHPTEHPNIVFIFIDDMGYGDLSCTGNRNVETQHIDRLAAEGARFTQFYVNSPICSPSRVAVTTGQYPARHLINSFLATRQRNRQRGMADFLDPQAPAIGRAFHDAGYATAHFGKWHMGGGRDVQDAPLPTAYGFDEHFVNFEGMGPKIDRSKTPKHQWTSIYVDKSIDFINRSKDRSFYLHLWLNDVHDKHVARPVDLMKYKKFAANPYEQALYAVLDRMDEEIGRLVDHIDASGLAENTIIVVTSDNGPTAWPKYYKEGYEPPGSTAGFRGRKWSLYEGGIRMPLIVRWPGHVPAGHINHDTVLAAIDFFPTLCTLANVPAPDVDFDGEQLSRAFLGEEMLRRKPILWEFGRGPSYLQPGLESDRSPNLAIRDGRWKLLINADRSRPELYDFATSLAEQANVMHEHPEVAARLSRQLLAWRESLPVRTVE